MKFNRFILGLAVLIAGVITIQAQQTITVDGKTYALVADSPVTPNLMTNALPPISATPTSQPSQIFGISGTNAQQTLDDAKKALVGLDWKNAGVGLMGFKGPQGYGFGIDVVSAVTNSIAQVGFGIYGAQEIDSQTGKKSIGFYDATLHIGVSTVEKIPVLGWNVRLTIESGPAFKIQGEGSGTILEQSAAYADMDFILSSKWVLTIGAGVIHCSDPHFENKAMPMAHADLVWHF